MLVQLIDNLIEIMENDPEYKFFTLDGQSIVLDDYLEVRPQMKDRLTKLIKGGRILIGPWYSLVDCFSVNPESIVRNLLMGNKVCKRYGEPMKLGYSIFSFGQMAQLPQVYSGFGINDIVFYKGASEKVIPKSEFIWIAPDGTEAFTTRLGKEKRWNFFCDFSVPVMLGGSMMKPGWKSSFTNGAKLCHMIDVNFYNHNAIELETDIGIREEEIKQAVQNVMAAVTQDSVSENVFLGFEGTDFTAPLKEIPKALKKANELMEGEVEFIHSNPLEYFNQVKEDIDTNSLVQYQGEMRFGPVSHVHSETMGSNVEIKQAMYEVENLLINYAEPLMSIYKSNGGKYDQDLFNLAWRYLLASQAHDSIHGAGDPKIKIDTLDRLAQAKEIAGSLTRRAVEGIATLIDSTGTDDITVAVFNTIPYKRSEAIKLMLDLPAEELVKDYWLEDMQGNRIETYQISRGNLNFGMVHPQNRPKTIYSDRSEVYAYIEDISPMGYKLLKVKRICGDPLANVNPFPQGSFPYDPIIKSSNVMDNGLIRLTINPNGSLDAYDYENEKTYKGLNNFTDTGCSGDFWVHREPFNNETISSLGNSAKISMIENSSLSATVRVKIVMEIPEKLVEKRSQRSEKLIPLEIVSEITMSKNSKRIDFKTYVTNNSKDHMLTVSFPSGIDAKYSYSECPFEVKKREIDNFTNDHCKKGAELERYSFHNFIDVNDEKAGIALMTKGLKEIGIINDKGAILNLTLLRAVTGTFPVHNDLFLEFEKETSQGIGEHLFEYALFAHNGDYKKGDVICESRKYAIPMLAAEIGSGKKGVLSDKFSFLSMKNKSLSICSIKQSEDGNGIIVRLNNPNEKTANETICFGSTIKKIYAVNMEENERELIGENTSELKLSVEPYKIITLYLG
jgi:alpha-mannosidase